MWSLLMISQALATCDKSYFFTECNQDMTQDLIVSAPSECGDYPKRYRGLDCTFECPANTFLDFKSESQICTPCPSGSFSSGGATVYGSHGIPWLDSLNSMINTCYSITNNNRTKNFNCTNWSVWETSIVSGVSFSESSYISELTFSAHIVKPGFLRVRYRKDTYRINGSKLGLFTIYLNGVQVFVDDEIDQSSWKAAKIPMDLGLNEVVIEYFAVQSIANMDPRALISVVEVYGTDYASKECYSCHKEFYNTDSMVCNVCDFNEYSYEETCNQCPPGTHSLKGAESVYDCLSSLDCTENDYRYVYTDCIDGLREKKAVWKKPILCNYLNFTLPQNILGVPCAKCNSGYFNQSSLNGLSKCIPCSDGKVMSSNETEGCIKCKAGTYALKSIRYSDWTDLPENFTTYCLQSIGSYCLDSPGWIPHTDFITTGANLKGYTEVFLNKHIYIDSYYGVITTDYEFINFNRGLLDIYVDGVWVSSWSNKEKRIGYTTLTKGNHYVQWAYQPLGESSEEVRIKALIVQGGVEGSAEKCIRCFKGYISGEGQITCRPCSPGFTSNAEGTACLPCPNSYYSSVPGSRCYKCPPGTTHNSQKTNCRATDYAYLHDNVYYIANLTGAGSDEGTYTKGICSMPTSKLYCIQTFYGPIPAEKQNFYISILNPSQLELPDASNFSSVGASFAYAVIEAQQPQGTKTNCNKPDTLISLGTLITGVNIEKNGFRIDYGNGDVCDEYKNTYNSSILIVCDKKASVGWPAFVETEMCLYKFVWNSKYGCPICAKEEMTIARGDCKDGVRKVRRIEGDGCIYPFLDRLETIEECSEYEDVFKSTAFIVTTGLIVVLLVVGTVSIGCYWKYTRGYKKLVEMKPESSSE